jgi:hypothetical protein
MDVARKGFAAHRSEDFQPVSLIRFVAPLGRRRRLTDATPQSA